MIDIGPEESCSPDTSLEGRLVPVIPKDVNLFPILGDAGVWVSSLEGLSGCFACHARDEGLLAL